MTRCVDCQFFVISDETGTKRVVPLNERIRYHDIAKLIVSRGDSKQTRVSRQALTKLLQRGQDRHFGCELGVWKEAKRIMKFLELFKQRGDTCFFLPFDNGDDVSDSGIRQ
jgi:hypothetical protein